MDVVVANSRLLFPSTTRPTSETNADNYASWTSEQHISILLSKLGFFNYVLEF